MKIVFWSIISLRFPSCFKSRPPFNALCLLDPRSTDMYFETEVQVNAAINTIKTDSIYNKMRLDAVVSSHQALPSFEEPANVALEVVTLNRRSELLARKRSLEFGRDREMAVGIADPVAVKIDQEITK